jgi:hypothetical protein
MATPKRRFTEVLERLDLPITLQETYARDVNEFEKVSQHRQQFILIHKLV